MRTTGDPEKFKRAYRACTAATDDEAEQWLRDTVAAIQAHLHTNKCALQKMAASEFDWICEVLRGGGVIRRYGAKIVADGLPELLSAELRAQIQTSRANPSPKSKDAIP